MAVTLARKIQHRQLMLKISQSLSEADLGDLKYLCGDIIGESALGNAKSCTDLFMLLQYQGQLGLDNYSFVSRGLSSIGRADLASMLPEAEESSVECRGDVLPQRDCELKHRMMMLAVADRMRREDVVKLLYVTSGKVQVLHSGKKVTGDAIGALQVLACLEESKLLHCSSYSVLCDLLQQIGRSDLADLVIGFPRNIPEGFTMQNQALALMMEVLRNKRKVYIFHQEKLSKMKDGNNEVVRDIHSILLRVCVDGLRTRCAETCTMSNIKAIISAFASQYCFLQCVMSDLSSCDQRLSHKKTLNFVDDAFGSERDYKIVESYACPVADSAHQMRKFILEVSCEIIGKEKVTNVHQLNDRVENGINICSGYGKHILSLLSCLACLLSSVSKKEVSKECYWTELMEIFTHHKNFLIRAFPLLAPHIQRGDLLASSQLEHSTLPSSVENSFNGLVAMVTIPSYSILLNLLTSTHVNTEKVLGDLVDYVHLPGHVVGSAEFVERCAAALYDHVACFRQDIVALDDLCAPLIMELINPTKGFL